jgi:uncharacterized protein
MSMRAITSTGISLGDSILLAKSLGARVKGLLGKSSLPAGEGLLIKPCKGIHTFFMKFPIDVVFLDQNDAVIALFRNFPPNRITPVYYKAKAVLELPAGVVDESVSLNDRINFS